MATDDQFPVFGQDGRLLGNLTGNYGQVPQAPDFNQTFDSFPALPALPSSFAPSATSKGNVVTSSGGASSGAGSIARTGSALGIPSNATAGTDAPAATASPATGPSSGSAADYFFRFIIVTLGFIFVAVGLNMFRPGTIPNPVRGIRH